jgi:heat shock protein HtpX
MAVVTAVILALYAVVLALAIAVPVEDPHDLRSWLVPPGVALMIGLFLSGAGQIALRAASARSVSREDAPELHALLDRLCVLADVPRPDLAVAQLPAANAFAVGIRPTRSTIAVSESLLQRLEPQEVESVIAHELGHVAHRDAAVVTAASLFPVIGAYLGRWRFAGHDYAERKRDWREYLFWPFEMVLALTLYLLGSLLTFAISRYREFDADRFSAVVTGAPQHLMSALQKLDGATDAIPKRDLRASAGLNALFIISVKRRRWELMMDHPPLAKRLAELGKISRELGKAA